jgi:hypothetical protein
MTMTRIELWVGTYVVWGIGAAVVLLIVGAILWACGWAFWELVQAAMRNFGTWNVWVQARLIKVAWVEWAANRARTGLTEEGHPSSYVDDLRKFFAKYDPDNENNWRPEPEGQANP